MTFPFLPGTGRGTVREADGGGAIPNVVHSPLPHFVRSPSVRGGIDESR